jgi:hypothetical protein
MQSVVSAPENWRRMVHRPASTSSENRTDSVVITQRPGCRSHDCGVVNLCPSCDMMRRDQRLGRAIQDEDESCVAMRATRRQPSSTAPSRKTSFKSKRSMLVTKDHATDHGHTLAFCSQNNAVHVRDCHILRGCYSLGTG